MMIANRYKKKELEKMLVADLKAVAKGMGVRVSGMRKAELVAAVLSQQGKKKKGGEPTDPTGPTDLNKCQYFNEDEIRQLTERTVMFADKLEQILTFEEDDPPKKVGMNKLIQAYERMIQEGQADSEQRHKLLGKILDCVPLDEVVKDNEIRRFMTEYAKLEKQRIEVEKQRIEAQEAALKLIKTRQSRNAQGWPK